MTILMNTHATTPACVEHDDIFQNPLLEEPSSANNVELRRRQLLMTRKAEGICLGCPLMVDCLYNAVVNHDVAGHCAGTTQRQRQEIRQRLGFRLDPEDFDSLAGASSSHQVDHNEIVRLRNANPNESLETIAQRLGCSLSTVKRHLRKARRGETVGRPPKISSITPTVTQVMDAYRDVVVVTRTPDSKRSKREVGLGRRASQSIRGTRRPIAPRRAA